RRMEAHPELGHLAADLHVLGHEGFELGDLQLLPAERTLRVLYRQRDLPGADLQLRADGAGGAVRQIETPLLNDLDDRQMPLVAASGGPALPGRLVEAQITERCGGHRRR